MIYNNTIPNNAKTKSKNMFSWMLDPREILLNLKYKMKYKIQYVADVVLCQFLIIYNSTMLNKAQPKPKKICLV